jgi:hypothetical protein
VSSGGGGGFEGVGGTSAVFLTAKRQKLQNLLAVRLYRELRQLKLRRRTLDAITLSAEPHVASTWQMKIIRLPAD